MWTKSDVINFALRKAGISSSMTLTSASPDMYVDALTDYEALVDELATTINIRPYKTNPPDIGDFTGLSDVAAQAVSYQLALRLCPDYLIEPTPRLEASAMQTLEALRVSMLSVPELERRNDMPIGQGWKFDYRDTFYRQANIVAGSQIVAVGDAGTYTVNFDQGQLLNGETISAVQSTVSDFGELEAVSNTDYVVTYRVKFNEPGAGRVRLVIAGTVSTVFVQVIDFDVREA